MSEAMTARIPCCVPHCPRSTDKPHTEWICREHWRLVHPRSRFAYSKAVRLGRDVVAAVLWQRIKKKAIEAAAVQETARRQTAAQEQQRAIRAALIEGQGILRVRITKAGDILVEHVPNSQMRRDDDATPNGGIDATGGIDL